MKIKVLLQNEKNSRLRNSYNESTLECRKTDELLAEDAESFPGL